MSQETFLRIFFSLILGLCFAWNIFSQYDEDVGSERTGDDGRRYRPYLPGCLLYLFFFLIVASSAFFYGPQKMPEATLSICFGIFFQICLYYAVLMPLLPFFRRRISARACATLWLLPNFLYITSLQFMEPNRPLLVFHAPIRLIWALFGIWLAGFLAVFLYHIISHLVFRARILRDAVPVTDPVTLNVWEQELTFLNIRKPKFQLLRSPTVSTPLSVGLYERTTRVVLPDRSYSREELSLILRHELIHISRGDPFAKLFMALCTASCWFNPPMWGAMRRCADDLELSCDETVLLNADGDTRQQYASLLLQTAGDERGFTTCLSASASALRYRLKHVVEPRKVGSGALAVGLIFFLLCITCGYVSLAYDSARGGRPHLPGQGPLRLHPEARQELWRGI